MSGESTGPRIVIAGGSGFLGISLAVHLAALAAESRFCPAMRRRAPVRHGRFVMPQRLRDERFEFRFPKLDEALHEVMMR